MTNKINVKWPMVCSVFIFDGLLIAGHHQQAK